MKPVMTKDQAKALEAKVEDHKYSDFWEKSLNAIRLVGKHVQPQRPRQKRRRRSNRHYKHSYLWNHYDDDHQLNILDYIEYANKALGMPITAKEERNNPGNFRMSVPDEGDGHHFHSVEISTVKSKEDPKHTGAVFYKFQNHRAFKNKYTHNNIDPLGNFMLMIHNHFYPDKAIDPRLNADLAQTWTDHHRAKFIRGRYAYFHSYKTHFSKVSKNKSRKIGKKSDTRGSNRNQKSGYVNKRKIHADPSGKLAIKYLCGRRKLPLPLVKGMLKAGLVRSYSGHSSWRVNHVLPGDELSLKTMKRENHNRIIRMIKDDIRKYPKDYPDVYKHQKVYKKFFRYQKLLVDRQKNGQKWPMLQDYLNNNQQYMDFIKFAKPKIDKYRKILKKNQPHIYHDRAKNKDEARYIIVNKVLFDYRDLQGDQRNSLTDRAIKKAVKQKYPKYAKHYTGNYNAKEHVYFEPIHYYHPVIEFVHRIPPNKKVARSGHYDPHKEVEVGADRIWLTDDVHTDRSMFNRGKEIVPKSFDHTVGFNFKTGPGDGKDTLYVMEDSIDTMSRYTLNWRKGYNENATYLSLEGVSKTEKIIPFLKAQYPKMNEYKNIVLCPDNDRAGHDMAERLASEIHDKSKGNSIKSPLTGRKINISVEVPGVAPYKMGKGRTYLKTAGVIKPKQFLHIKDYNDILQALPNMSSSLRTMVLKHPNSRMSLNHYSDYIIDNQMRELTGRGHTRNLNWNNPKRFNKMLCAYQGLYNHAPKMQVNNQNEFVKRMKYELDHMSKTGRIKTLSFMNDGGGTYLSPKNLFHYSKVYERQNLKHNISYAGLNRSSREMAESLDHHVDNAMAHLHSVTAKQGLAYALRSYVPILKANQYGMPKTARDKAVFKLGYRLNRGSLKKIYSSKTATKAERSHSASDFYEARLCLANTLPAFNNSPGSNFDLIGQHATKYLVKHHIPTGHVVNFMQPEHNPVKDRSAGHLQDHAKSGQSRNGQSDNREKSRQGKGHAKGSEHPNLKNMGEYYQDQRNQASRNERRDSKRYESAVDTHVTVKSQQTASHGRYHGHGHGKDGR